jgi:hypothetical protein
MKHNAQNFVTPRPGIFGGIAKVSADFRGSEKVRFKWEHTL